MLEPNDPLFPEEAAPTLSITPVMKEDMRAAARWSQVVAIAGIAINGLLGMVSFILIGVFWFMSGFEDTTVRVLSLVYSLLGFYCVFYVYVSILLYRYSDRLGKYAQTSTQSAFEAFFVHQERFWKLFGGSLAVFLIIYLVGVIAFGLFVA